MRTISIVKASLFTLILAFMVIGTIAIAEVMKKEQPVGEERAVVSETWYFNGASNPLDNNPLDATQYSKTPSHQCNNIPQTVCTIMAPAKDTNPNEPNLQHPVDGTETVENQIEQALESEDLNDTVTAFRSN